ncbi:indole-3-acetic acid inducible 29 [Hibiscus trionum]|uniref:Auxin-responsive protein n=1 Tax=Hibiscus trionum TaxID=183268 RepID=A0A9W7JLM6_HIBTR|nr:indole-3-acetic acid inducible 29 [Hibiscus trionum]
MSDVELQLCLALPTPDITKGFNSNNYHGLGFDHLKQTSCFGDRKKRDFEQALGNFSDECNAMPLLLWSGQPNEEDDNHKYRNKRTFTIDDMNDAEEDKVVGWPPIKSWRKRTCHHHHHHERAAGNGNGNGRSIYVKVKMEGVAIARKIDMRHYHSYQHLTNSLISIFTKNKKCDEHYNARYTLTYQDKEGDWLVAGDIPWNDFITTVQRLKILRLNLQTQPQTGPE